jgi:hypothetical protein
MVAKTMVTATCKMLRHLEVKSWVCFFPALKFFSLAPPNFQTPVCTCQVFSLLFLSVCFFSCQHSPDWCLLNAKSIFSTISIATI